MLLFPCNLVYISEKKMEHTHSTSSVMDRTHHDGMWFSSWENFLLLFLIRAEEKKKQPEVQENLLVQNGQKATYCRFFF